MNSEIRHRGHREHRERRSFIALLSLCSLCPLWLTCIAVAGDVLVREVNDYVFGGYAGDFTSPPHADGNPKRAVIVSWSDHPYRLVFSHEASYCPWLEFPSGAAACFQFFEGNDGWAELFNQRGRLEKNSFIEIVESGPKRVHIRWTYFGVNLDSGKRAYRATEDFYAYPNGLVLRRQSYRTLMPGDPHGYAREPIELIGVCPVGKTWADVLRDGQATAERHALSVIDAFSDAHYEVFWSPDGKHRREGSAWKDLDDARGVALILPLRDKLAFCAFGDASGFPHERTKLKEHTFADTGGSNWGTSSWDHWPIGWLNSQGHPVDAESSKKYPSHFSPMGMDFFAMGNEEVEGGVYWSLCGTADSEERIRAVVRQWLEGGAARVMDPSSAAGLPPTQAQSR